MQVKKDVDDLSSSYFLHDSDGNIVQAINGIGTVKIAYDGENRPISVTYPNRKSIIYEYNEFQRRVGLKVSELNLVYEYDQLNRLSEVVRVDSGTADVLLKLEYNSQGMLSKRVLGNGASSEYVMDPVNSKLSRVINYFPNGSISSYFEYNYDKQGRIIQENTTLGIWHYKYDAASQLIEAKYPHGKTVRYTYDKRKNRVQVSEEPGNKTLYFVNEVNQYTSVGNYEIKYDADGNMVEKTNRDLRKDSVKFKFSIESKLLQAETPNRRWETWPK